MKSNISQLSTQKTAENLLLPITIDSQLSLTPCLPEIFHAREDDSKKCQKQSLFCIFRRTTLSDMERMHGLAKRTGSKSRSRQDSFSLLTLKWKQEVFIKDFHI